MVSKEELDKLDHALEEDLAVSQVLQKEDQDIA